MEPREDLSATAVCKVAGCGQTVTRLEAPLHIEDHVQRGEFPPGYGGAQ